MSHEAVSNPEHGHDRADPRSIADRLHSAAIHLLRALKSTDRAQGVSQAQLSALSVLHFAGKMSISDLANAEGVKVPTMSRLVKDMTAAYLVAREAHPADARTSVVKITGKGKRLFQRAREARLRSLAQALEGMDGCELLALSKAVASMERAAQHVRSA